MQKPSAIFSLVSTIVGGGVLSLPYAFSKTGIIGGPLLLITCAFLGDYSVYLLLMAARYGAGVETMEEVAKKAFGRRAQVATVMLLFGLTWTCCVAYTVLIGDMLAPLVTWAIPGLTIPDNGLKRKLLLVVQTIVVGPLGALKSLHALRFTSVICVFSVGLLAVCISIRSVRDGVAFNHPSSASIKYWPTSIGDILYALPIYFISFLCHFNVLSTHCELVKPSRHRVQTVVHLTMLICTVLYIAVGVMGYLYALDKTCGDITDNFGTGDVLINIGRFALALTLSFSYPLLVLPCRESAYRLWTMLRHDCRSESAEGDAIPDADVRRDSSLIQDMQRPDFTSVVIDVKELEESSLRRVMLAATVTITALLTALVIPDILMVWSYMGSSLCVVIAFIFPSTMYLKITWHKTTEALQILRTSSDPEERRGRWYILWVAVGAALLLVFSSVTMVGGVYEAVVNTGSPDSCKN